ncbi:MAG: HDOD domain-containing protein [Pseudomonadota bacterium]
MHASRTVTHQEENRFGRFQIQSELGKGSQGVVYLAYDPSLKRRVAIKVLTSVDEAVASGDAENRLREGEISGKLNHPHIVTVFDAGDSDIGPFLVFEYVEGEPMSKILKAQGPYSIRAAVPLIRSILDALSVAHRSLVVHLDLSPRNILIAQDGKPRIMDFGLSQYVHKIPRRRDYAVGTLRYMAPEHFVGEDLGPHTDVFALGSTFLEMVTGHRAMQGESFTDIRQKIVDAKPDYAHLAEIDGGALFEKFLRRALARKAEDRYANGADMLAAFESFVREADMEAAAVENVAQHSTIEYLLRRMRRKKEFPAVSRTLADINRLTSSDSDAPADKLANVILRDFALTSKLLKLVNSSFYGTRGGKITNVSQAVVLLGLEQVRMTANSLTFFGHMKSSDTLLKDSMARSFLSGLIARHMAKRQSLPTSEEAFITGMFQSLGENLVIYYFRDEYDEMHDIVRSDAVSLASAAQTVLGVNFADIGSAVAASWQLPKALIFAIQGVPDGELPEPETPEEQVRDIAVFANQLCQIVADTRDGRDGRLAALLGRFAASVNADETYCLKMIGASVEKLRQYAPIFELNVDNSEFCRNVSTWVASRLDAANDGDAAEARPVA